MKNFQFIALIFIVGIVACNRKSNISESPVNTRASHFISTNEDVVYTPVLISNNLPDKVNEQSGLVWYNNMFWINNDSGNSTSLFAYNSGGELVREVEVINTENVDWEDLTDDSNYIYIGDFGNNYGHRKNLKVLRLAKSDFGNGDAPVEVEEIAIEWSDQTQFSNEAHKHNFDCEAFFALGDSLYFFSKNWDDKKTRMYSSSKELGAYKLDPKGEFNTEFMVTGSAISSDGKVMALIGYKDYITHLMLFTGYEGVDFFSGSSFHVNLTPLGPAQTEAIVFGENDMLYVSTEKTILPQSLYKIEWKQWLKK